VLAELHDSEAAPAQIADLLILLDGVVVTQRLQDAVEMCRLPALPMGDGGCQVSNRFLADWTLGKLDLGFVWPSIAPLSGSGFSVRRQLLLILPVDVLGQILGDLADGRGQVLFIVDLLLQLSQTPWIRFFCYPNQNFFPCAFNS
jgi:hypothetical protein